MIVDKMRENILILFGHLSRNKGTEKLNVCRRKKGNGNTLKEVVGCDKE